MSSLINTDNNNNASFILSIPIEPNPNNGEVLQYNAVNNVIEWVPVSALPSLLNCVNIGTGSQVFNNIVSGIASFRTLKSSSNITVVQNPSEIDINLNNVLLSISQINSNVDNIEIRGQIKTPNIILNNPASQYYLCLDFANNIIKKQLGTETNIYTSDGYIPPGIARSVAMSNSTSSLQIGQPGTFTYGLYIDGAGNVGLKSDLVGVDIGSSSQPYTNITSQTININSLGDINNICNNFINTSSNDINLTCGNAMTLIASKMYAPNIDPPSSVGLLLCDGNNNGYINKTDSLININMTTNTSFMNNSFSPNFGTIPQNADMSINFNSQLANRCLMSPNGSSGIPSFRSIVNADLPINDNVTGTNLWTSNKINNELLTLRNNAFFGTNFGFNNISVLLRDIFSISSNIIQCQFDIYNDFTSKISQSYKLNVSSTISNFTILKPISINNSDSSFLQCEIRFVSNLLTVRFRLKNGTASTYTPVFRIINYIGTLNILPFASYTDTEPTTFYNINNQNISLNNMLDTNINSPSNNQILVYNSGSQKWENQNQATQNNIILNGVQSLTNIGDSENIFSLSYSSFTPIHMIIYVFKRGNNQDRKAYRYEIKIDNQPANGNYQIKNTLPDLNVSNFYILRMNVNSFIYTFTLIKTLWDGTSQAGITNTYNIFNYGYTNNGYTLTPLLTYTLNSSPFYNPFLNNNYRKVELSGVGDVTLTNWTNNISYTSLLKITYTHQGLINTTNTNFLVSLLLNGITVQSKNIYLPSLSNSDIYINMTFTFTGNEINTLYDSFALFPSLNSINFSYTTAGQVNFISRPYYILIEQFN